MEKLAARYDAIENKLEGFSKLFAKIPWDIDLVFNSLQEKTGIHDGEIQDLRKELKRVENIGWWG